MVIQEAAIALLTLLLALGLELELVRRASFEVLLRHACFVYVRSRALGAGEARSRHAVFDLFERALGRRKTRSLFIGLHLDEERVGDGLEAKVHTRFRSFMPFPGKHHFEMTRKCRFYF